MTDARTKEQQLSTAAHQAVTAFVNAQNCQNKDQVVAALLALGEMAAAAIHTVRHGKCEKLS